MKPRSSPRVLADVLTTLVRREWNNRLARGRLLTLWTMIEPLLMVFAIGLLYTAAGRHTVGGQEAHLFIGVGIFMFSAWRNLCLRPTDAISAGAGLLTYRQVHVLDLTLSKWFVEVLIYALLITVALVGLLLTQDSIELRFSRFAFGLAVLLSSSLGIACLLSTINRYSPGSITFLRPVFFALYISSGALHPVWDLPESVANVLAYNPIVQLIELFRESLLAGYESSLRISGGALMMMSLLPLVVGFAVVLQQADALRSR